MVFCVTIKSVRLSRVTLGSDENLSDGKFEIFSFTSAHMLKYETMNESDTLALDS